MGPMLVLIWDGFLYALVMVEVSCWYSVGQVLRWKEDVETIVRDVVVMLERQ